jgi:hypothetical protein
LSAQKDAPTQMGVRYNSAMVWQFLKSLWLILCGTCPLHGEPLDIVKKIVSYPMIQFDQVIQEGAWVHFSVAPAMRQQVLTAHFVDGVARYQEGVSA